MCVLKFDCSGALCSGTVYVTLEIVSRQCRYMSTIRAWVGSSLKVLDNKILNTSMSSKPLAEVDGVAAKVTATDTVLDDAEGGERCVSICL